MPRAPGAASKGGSFVPSIPFILPGSCVHSIFSNGAALDLLSTAPGPGVPVTGVRWSAPLSPPSQRQAGVSAPDGLIQRTGQLLHQRQRQGIMMRGFDARSSSHTARRNSSLYYCTTRGASPCCPGSPLRSPISRIETIGGGRSTGGCEAALQLGTSLLGATACSLDPCRSSHPCRLLLGYALGGGEDGSSGAHGAVRTPSSQQSRRAAEARGARGWSVGRR